MATGPALPWVPESLGVQPSRTALPLLQPSPSPPKAKEERRAGGQGSQLGREESNRQPLSPSLQGLGLPPGLAQSASSLGSLAAFPRAGAVRANYPIS